MLRTLIVLGRCLESGRTFCTSLTVKSLGLFNQVRRLSIALNLQRRLKRTGVEDEMLSLKRELFALAH